MLKFYPNYFLHSRNLLSALLILFCFSAYGQQKTIKGKVVDGETGDVLPGVTIVEVGTNNGDVTDVNGNFTLTVQEGASISISYLGFVTQTVKVNSDTDLNINLEPDIQSLEEVVVVGYGTQKKSSFTGSAVSVDGEKLKKVPVSTVAESLTGRLAGVQIASSEGSPDADIQIRVRGRSSLTQSSNPLFIVDGFPVATIADIAPSDIESIDVLKDASSTAIYGSRGANGVVIITTKSGKEGKVTVSYNTFYAVKELANRLEVLDPFDFARLQYEYAVLDDPEDLSSYENFFGLYQDIDLYEGLPANDWQQQVFGRTGTTFSNDLSIRGGGKKFNYALNLARFDDRAILIGSGYERNNITLKFKNTPSDKIEINYSLRYSDTEIQGGGANEQNEFSSSDSRLRNAVGYAPVPIDGISLTDTDETVTGGLVNPIIAFNDNDRFQRRKNFNIGAGFSWKIIDRLKFSSSFTVDNYNFIDNRFFGVSTSKARNNSSLAPDQPSVIFEDDKQVRFRTTNLLNYDVLEKQGHNLKLLVGTEYLFRQTEQLEYEIQGYPVLFTADEAFKLTTQGIPFTVDNFQAPDDKLLSFFSRANYDFEDKYLVTASYRVDGSSRFLGDNVWGFFPAISAGWKMSEESFLKDGLPQWVDQMKLRAGFGITGNNNIPTGQTSPIFSPTTTARINDEDRFWSAGNVLSNPDLKWETTQTINIGLDFGLLKGRVNSTVEVYQNSTTDLLLERPLTGANGGYTSRFENVGEIRNRGIEFSTSVIAIDKKDYGLSMNFNIAFNDNEIISLGGLQELGGDVLTTRWASSRIPQDYIARVGGPIGLIYGYVNEGRYEVSDFEGYVDGEWILRDGVVDNDILDVAPGVQKLADLNGDGTVTIEDRQVIGNTNPSHTGGFVLNAYAYGFDFTAAFNWSYGNDVYNANKIQFTTARDPYRNLITLQEDGRRWTNIDWSTGELITDPDRLAAANANTTMWSPFSETEILSDWAVEDGSFLRLNTLSLGYTLPGQLLEKTGIETLRFYVTGYNVFIWTNYSGYDPEVSTRRRTQLTPGVDFSAYPRSRQLTVGMNLTF